MARNRAMQTFNEWFSSAFPHNYTSIKSLLEDQTELSFESLRPRLVPAYWVTVSIAILAAWGFEEYYANAQFNTLYFRLAVCIVALPLFSRPFPKATFLARYQRLYFALFMSLLFPILFSWNGLANAVYADSTETLSGAWLTEYALAVFIFMGLFANPTYALVICFMSLIGTSVAVMYWFDSTNDAVLGTIFFMVATLITAFAFLLTTRQQLNYVLQHRLETAYSIGSRVAHELRTPLLSIRNFAKIAQQSATIKPSELEDPDSKASKALEHIIKEVDFSNRTIDILLVSTSKAPFNFDPESSFSADEVINSAVNSYPYSNSSERACVSVGGGKDFRGSGPHELVVHALYNLIKNALLSAASYETSKIVVDKFWNKSEGVITVSDNGPGIPLRLQHKVFDDFFTTRNPGDGTGLGLAFCKSLMAQIGGKIDYKRTEDLSVFRMTFPLKVLKTVSK